MMDETSLVSVASLENAWARLSASPDYQRSVTKFFKAPVFYIRCTGLFAGTSRASGKRAVYCNESCCQRITQELTALVGAMLVAQPPQPDLLAEDVEDIQMLNLQNEEEVKALFKEFKRAARNQRQGRQLEAAHALLQAARRWAAPLRWPPPVSPPGPPAETVCGEPINASTQGVWVTATCGANTATVGALEVEATVSGAVRVPADGTAAGLGFASGVAAGVSSGEELHAPIGGNSDDGAPPAWGLRSHPLMKMTSCLSDSEDKEGSGASEGGCCEAALTPTACCQANGGRCAGAVQEGPPASSAPAFPPGIAPSTLRTLRTAAGTDPWAGSDPGSNPSRPHDAAAAAAAASCSGSGRSSVAASGTATPAWAPGTPRFALPHPVTAAAGTAAAAAVTVSDVADGDISGAGPCNSSGGGSCAQRQQQQQQPQHHHHRAAAVAAVSASATTRGSGCSGGGEEGVLVVCCCIDLEWWERDSSKVTEVGWTMWDNLTRRLESRHHIVAEHEALVNRIHVPDHKHDFLFGTSTTGSLGQGAAALQQDLNGYGAAVWEQWCGEPRQRAQQAPEQLEQPGPETLSAAAGPGTGAGTAGSCQGCPPPSGSPGREAARAAPPAMPRIQVVVVGHGLSGDLKAMSELLGVALPPGAAILDTADLAWAVLGGGAGQERTAMSLRLLLKTLDIQATKLHNGGNDARFTMEAMLALAAMEPVAWEQQQQPHGVPNASSS